MCSASGGVISIFMQPTSQTSYLSNLLQQPNFQQQKIARWLIVTAQMLYLLNISHWHPNMIELFSEIFEWKSNFWERTRISLYQSRVLWRGQGIGNYLSYQREKMKLTLPRTPAVLCHPLTLIDMEGLAIVVTWRVDRWVFGPYHILGLRGHLAVFSSRSFLMPANQKTQLPQDEIQDNKQMHDIQDACRRRWKNSTVDFWNNWSIWSQR